MMFAYRAYTYNHNKLSQEELKRAVFYYMAMIVEMAHSYTNMTTEEISRELGVRAETINAVEHADTSVALNVSQLEKLAALCKMSVHELLNIDEFYSTYSYDSYHVDDDGDPCLEWDDEYVGEYDDNDGEPIVLQVWEVNEIEHRYGSIWEALEKVYFPQAGS